MAAAEHHQEIGDHRRFPLIIQFNGLFFFQTFQRHFYHSHSAVYDHFPGVDNGGGLLALQHDGGDLRRVGKVGDPGIDDLKPRFFYLFLKYLADTGSDLFAGAAQASFIGNTVTCRIYIRRCLLFYESSFG